MRYLAATAAIACYLVSSPALAACDGPPWWNTRLEPSPDGRLTALWRGAFYSVDPATGDFAHVSAAPVDRGALCSRPGELYILSAARQPPSLVASVKVLPLLIVPPHQDVVPSLSRVGNGAAISTVEGPRLAYHYSAAPLSGGRAVFMGYWQRAALVVDQNGSVWKRQPMRDPSGLQSPASLGAGEEGAIHSVVLTRREAVVTTFRDDGVIVADVTLDLPQVYRSARVDRRFVTFVGLTGGRALFWVTAGRNERGEGRSAVQPVLVAVAGNGTATLHEAPNELGACSAHHVAADQDDVAVVCRSGRAPVVKVWSLSSGRVSQVGFAPALLNPHGFARPGLVLTAVPDGGLTLMAFEAVGASSALRAIHVQQIRRANEAGG